MDLHAGTKREHLSAADLLYQNHGQATFPRIEADGRGEGVPGTTMLLGEVACRDASHGACEMHYRRVGRQYFVVLQHISM
jgi:hypothetical protein